jgi:hypothetical protein
VCPPDPCQPDEFLPFTEEIIHVFPEIGDASEYLTAKE